MKGSEVQGSLFRILVLGIGQGLDFWFRVGGFRCKDLIKGCSLLHGLVVFAFGQALRRGSADWIAGSPGISC